MSKLLNVDFKRQCLGIRLSWYIVATSTVNITKSHPFYRKVSDLSSDSDFEYSDSPFYDRSPIYIPSDEEEVKQGIEISLQGVGQVVPGRQVHMYVNPFYSVVPLKES